MRYEFNFCLPLPGHAERLSVCWDDETGELVGENLDIVKSWADEAKTDGFIKCERLAGQIPATDPLRIKSEFCALIGYEQLSDDLKKFYPTFEYPGFERF
jgi:hypothetical protein